MRQDQMHRIHKLASLQKKLEAQRTHLFCVFEKGILGSI